MRGRIQYKNGRFEINYPHKAPGRDNRGFEKWKWKTKIYPIFYTGDIDISLLIGCKVRFLLKIGITLSGGSGDIFAILDNDELKSLSKSKIRDYKINKLING